MEDEEGIGFNQKYQDYEKIPLSPHEVIDKFRGKKKKKYCTFKDYIKIFFFLIIIFFFIISFRYYLQNSPDIEYDQSLNQTIKPKTKEFNNNTINIINNETKVNYTSNFINNDTKAYNINNDSKVKNNDVNTQKINNKQLNIAFLYSTLYGNGIARFMIVTGEYFVRKGYNVYFLTKPPYAKDFKFNKKIKRIYAFHNWTIIEETIKKEKIDILIVNNVFNLGMINTYKSYGVKVIGIFHGVYFSAMYNNDTMVYRSWRYVDSFDAYIHIAADDYYFFSHFGFKRNIFIPNLYTFDPSEVPSSNLTHNNIIMLGRLNDKKKGVIFALKAMELIVKEIPDARLNLVSSDSRIQEFKNISVELNITKNVIFMPYVEKISEIFLNTSVFLFPSLTEAFPMALNEAKAYGLPCVTFDISYSIPFQSGVIKVEMFDYEALARETILLLKDYNYRIKRGREAKLSLNRFTNEETTELWGRLFNSLLKGENEFQKLRREIRNKYYDEKIAEEHMETQLKYLKRYNKFFECHSLKNFADLNYINNIQECKNVKRRRRRRR